MAGERHVNNFDVLRLLAAALVIFSHGYGLCNKTDPFQTWCNALPGGQIAVYIFFTISGYLITGSWYRRPEIIPFFEKRILRIFPALIVVVLLSMFIFAPILTTLPLRDYFSSRGTYTYLWNLSLWKLQFHLPGVYIDGELAYFNAPLWTLFFEFLMYILTAFFGIVGLLKHGSRGIWFIWFLLVAFIALGIYGIPKELFIIKISAYNFVHFFIYYFTGVLYFYYRENKKINGFIVLILLVIANFTRGTIVFEFVAFLTITSFVFWMAFLKVQPLKFITSKGDFSYGLYLYGCIVQHYINYYLDCSMPLYVLIPLTILLTCPFAYLSWKFVESKALRLKLRI